MKKIFADTNYFIAMVNKNDQLHDSAMAKTIQLGQIKLYTSEGVFIEILNYFSKRGPHLKLAAQNMIYMLRNDPNVYIVTLSAIRFEAAFQFYCDRPDQEYSLTDCDSMLIMKQHGIEDVFTSDGHFAYEGFNCLL